MNMLQGRCRVGVDVGGTFTDVVCVRDGRAPVVFKVPSTPADPGDAAIAAIQRLAAREGVESCSIAQLAHGTTVATNAVLERKGGRLGIITTEGFRDTLEIGRQMRREMYEVRLDPQTPVFLAPRAMRLGVRERIGPQGEVIEPLDESSVRAALDGLVAAGVECIAVCLLFSFVNPTHERRVREMARADHPGLEISLSSEVDPAFREYERTAVTAFDAYIKPTVRRYLTRLGTRLADAGVPAPLQVMQSRGGLSSADLARDRPVRLFLSGPAAGVIGGQATGTAAGFDDLITLDVGGTSSDIALVSGAKPLLRAEGVIDGFPVRVPMVDVNAIGAGGGSIAWLDDAGGLRVGPRSAASDPGPACYARGGTEPTVTDASVVLGFLDPGRFAGGAIRLDPSRAVDAIRDRVAEPLGLDVEDAAAGIHRVVNAQMAEGIRLVSVRQGFDPREFTLVAMGGAGPLHACALAADLGIARVVVPRHPGVLSAAGLLAAPIEHEVSVAYGEPFAGLSMTPVRRMVAELDATGRKLTEREGLAPDEVEILHFADVCHVGQGYFLEVPFHPRADDGIERLYADFLAAHERVHGHAVEAPARFVNLRSVHRQRMSSGANAPESGGAEPPGSAEASQACGRGPGSGGFTARRMVRFPDEAVRVGTRIATRDTLAVGDRLRGPAIVEQDDTTTLIAPGWSALVGDGGIMTLIPESTTVRA
ncbi:MAG: hydantoinase/oxoprolinase family protein [Thiotrichales bacterium]|nr:hydantoinase/oxoprolinase family protein [Thiotrichales bacterium]